MASLKLKFLEMVIRNPEYQDDIETRKRITGIMVLIDYYENTIKFDHEPETLSQIEKYDRFNQLTALRRCYNELMEEVSKNKYAFLYSILKSKMS